MGANGWSPLLLAAQRGYAEARKRSQLLWLICLEFLAFGGVGVCNEVFECVLHGFVFVFHRVFSGFDRFGKVVLGFSPLALELLSLSISKIGLLTWVASQANPTICSEV